MVYNFVKLANIQQLTYFLLFLLAFHKYVHSWSVIKTFRVYTQCRMIKSVNKITHFPIISYSEPFEIDSYLF